MGFFDMYNTSDIILNEIQTFFSAKAIPIAASKSAMISLIDSIPTDTFNRVSDPSHTYVRLY